MGNKLLLKNTIGFLLIALLILSSQQLHADNLRKDFYQVKIYHLKNNEQVQQVDEFLQNAYLPALHRLGVKNIGVFKPVNIDTMAEKAVYVFTRFSSADAWMKKMENLKNDVAYKTLSKKFSESPADNPAFQRIESILLEAFPGQKEMVLPTSKSKDKIFELRSYESPTESLFEKKMEMFNNGEIDIFNRLAFHSVFYAKVLSGSRMPNLMYMPVFDSAEEKDAHWKSFGNDEQWKEMSAKPENENKVSVSHIDSMLLHSAAYSDF